MRATNGAIVPPMAFIPAAERYRLMPALDRWVLGSVLGHLVDTPGDRRLYAINLSSASLLDESFPEFVRTELTGRGVAPERICFEITESVAIAHLSRAIEMIGELREFGCLFAIDDFGSGMSSFNYLKHLRVDYLKIDGSLVRGVVHDPVHYAMVESINRIGQLMGVRTVAEFVEDDATLEAVRAMGVDCAQGFGVARPYSIERAQAAA
ncbi:MAG: EAL domain-containing protein [Proteobacteria bacterium]|nr:EAL domain-containing protein [Pseudomonadota bacterium]